MPPKRKKKGGGTTTPTAASADDIDDIDDFDDDEVSYPIMSKKAFLAKARADNAARANTAASKAGTTARYTALSGYHLNLIESGKQTIHQIDLSVESTQLSAANSLKRKRGHDGGSSISSAAAASTLTGAPPLRH
jgi:hypothetical protein